MKKPSKKTIKKVAIVMASIAGTAGVIYLLNRSELGYSIKRVTIEHLVESIVKSNHRSAFIHVSMDKEGYPKGAALALCKETVEVFREKETELKMKPSLDWKGANVNG